MISRPLDTGIASSDVVEFHFRLMREPLFVPDVYRDDRRLLDAMMLTWANPATQTPMAIVQPDGQLRGVYYIGDVVPDHEGTLYLWSWGNALTATTVRDIQEYIRITAESYALRRLTARTPCDSLGKALERFFRFKQEGRFSRAYKANGKYLNLYQYRVLF